MYTGTITYHGTVITVSTAVSLKLITVDGNGDIWLTQDTAHIVKITGNLSLK